MAYALQHIPEDELNPSAWFALPFEEIAQDGEKRGEKQIALLVRKFTLQLVRVHGGELEARALYEAIGNADGQDVDVPSRSPAKPVEA